MCAWRLLPVTEFVSVTSIKQSFAIRTVRAVFALTNAEMTYREAALHPKLSTVAYILVLSFQS
jgi:hypothetical protein